MSYEEGSNLMNFLKTTAAKARSSAANTHKKGSSQFKQLNFDNFSDNTFITFQSPSPKRQTEESPVKKLNLFQSNYNNNNKDQQFSITPTNYATNNNSYHNTSSFFNSKTNNPPQFNTQFNSGNSVPLHNHSYFNNPEMFIKKTNSFIKQNYDQSSSFSSARQETSQLLENISLNLRKEISNIDTKIHNFYRAMDSTLQEFFKNIKRQIYEMMQEAIVHGIMKSQQSKKAKQQRFVGQLYRVKDSLQKEYAKIEVMKSGMKGEQWRKTAGEVISNDIEQKVYDLMRKSSVVEVQKWEPPNIMPQLKEIQKKLAECLSLR